MSIVDSRFMVKQPLGAGGFGQVYAAHDVVTGATVALKFLMKADADARARFEREARIQAKLASNQHVLRVVHSNLDHAPPYIVTEFCDMGSLQTWVGEPRDWKEVAAALTHVVVGLSGIHDAGGFHRDIKPENLLVKTNADEPGTVLIKLSDFGLARSGQSSKMTRDGAGTEGYIAPEVLAGGDFTSAADLFSIGIVACELLTGSKDPAMLAKALMPEEMRKLVGALLSSEPAERPTLQRVAQVLGALLTEDAPHATTQPEREGEPHALARAGLGAAEGGLLLGALLVGAVIAILYLIAKGVSADPDDSDSEAA